MRFSIRFNNDMPVAAYPPLARAAEDAGFDQFWVSDDLFLRGVWPILSACALATRRINLGTCIVNPYTMHPAEIAMQAAALDELSGGRALLGIGAGAGDFLGWVGLPQPQPLATTAATLHALRALFAGERGAAAHPAWSPEAYLRFSTRQVPLYLGAMSPKMQQLIGAAADGGLPLLFPPERYTDVAQQVAAGAAQAGRDLAEVDLAACIWVSVAEDRAAAERVLRDKIAYYGYSLSDDILGALGVARAEFVPIRHALQTLGDAETAAALVTDAMLRIGIVGTPAELLPRLRGLVAAGARHLSFGPPIGPDPLHAIELLGAHVLPVLRSSTP